MLTTTLHLIGRHAPCERGWTTLVKALPTLFSVHGTIELGYILDTNGVDDTLWALRAVREDPNELIDGFTDFLYERASVLDPGGALAQRFDGAFHQHGRRIGVWHSAWCCLVWETGNRDPEEARQRAKLRNLLNVKETPK